MSVFFAEAQWPSPQPHQQPEVVHTAEELVEAILYGAHVDRVVVFPGGLSKIGHEDMLPEDMTQAMRNSANTLRWLEHLSEPRLEAIKLGKARAAHAACRDDLSG